jgi:hypothetical protein
MVFGTKGEPMREREALKPTSRKQAVFPAQSTYFPRDETGLVCLPTQLERTLQLNW